MRQFDLSPGGRAQLTAADAAEILRSYHLLGLPPPGG